MGAPNTRFDGVCGHPETAIFNDTLNLRRQQRFWIERFVQNDPSSDYREVPGRNEYENLSNSQLKIAVVMYEL